MDGHPTLGRVTAVFAVLALTVAASAMSKDSAALVDASEVLSRIESAAVDSSQVSSPAQLLNDIVAFRSQAAALEPKKAAAMWFALLDRATSLSTTDLNQDYRAFDVETRDVVGPRSVLASLPAPVAWPAMRDEARARADRKPQEPRLVALRLMMELLAGDRDAAQSSLKQIETIAVGLAPDDREELLTPVGQVRAALADLYGSPEEIAATFVGSLASGSRHVSLFIAESIPDLVGLVGEARATELMREIIVRPVMLRVESGDETRALARKVAVERIEALRVPQWSLVDSIDAADLYEALMHRFDGKTDSSGANPDSPSEAESGSLYRPDADVYYFLAMLLRGKQDAALTVFTRIAQGKRIEIPRAAMTALQRLGRQDLLYGFLSDALPKHPEWRAWDVYIEQASFTGHASEALALLDAQLSRSDLPDFVRSDLRAHRINALLARDDIAPATRALRELLAAAPAQSERNLKVRADAAVRLAGLGRVLSRPDLSDAGLSFLSKVVKLPTLEAPQTDADANQTLVSLFAGLRKIGRDSQAQSIAIEELSRPAGGTSPYEKLGFAITSPAKLLAMTELVGLYVAAGRNEDAVMLLERSAKWGTQDLSSLVQLKDSLGVPLALSAARALAATGHKAEALSLLNALVRVMPGYDPAYELLVSLEPQPLPLLDAMYRRDAFEERPLIWQAVVLRQQGRLDEAKAIIQRALSVDPSDGDEGPNDRMRGYAVLADILEAKGDSSGATEYRKAVAAIRISERADELHTLGLYQRAFAGYREALTHFQNAYCIQSRLAVQLTQQGRRSEALEHYRRAYELMPESFGRVESHCFGCESVFQGNEQQRIAEEVFTSVVARSPGSPQPHYLLGYLREEQHRYAEALQSYRAAVSLDPDYLNAWKHMDALADHIHFDADERDIVRIRLLELDPRQQHIRYDVSRVGDLALLWRALEKARTLDTAPPATVYPLRRSKELYDAALAKLPDTLREQMTLYQSFAVNPERMGSPMPSSRSAIARHVLIAPVAQLMGVEPNGFSD